MTSEPDLSPVTALADLLDVLVRLHDRELDPALIDGLRGADVPGLFAETLTGPAGRAAAQAFTAALAALPQPLPQATQDDLAAEFADIYLTHGYRAAPTGSVWLTEERLERQEPMFEVREFYAHYDIVVPDWRLRSDDHLVHELQFVAFLIRRGERVAAADAALFLDQHLLPWLPAFCVRAGAFLRHPFYQALFALSLATLDELRDRLVAELDTPRAVRLLPDAEAVPPAPTEAYAPGLGESW